MKVCKKCLLSKDYSLFHKDKSSKDGYKSVCSECTKESNKRYRESNKEKISNYRKINKDKFDESYKKYLIKNKDKRKEDQKRYNKKWVENNKDYHREYSKSYYPSYYDENKESIKEKSKEYYKNNKDIINEKLKVYNREKRVESPLFKFKQNIRNLIKNSFIKKLSKKSKKTTDILCCSYDEFRVYIESLFDSEMSWDNYGIYWEIDHILPLDSANNIDDVVKLNHYTNLRPLSKEENRKKSNKQF